mgnify:CR=1 FL=1
MKKAFTLLSNERCACPPKAEAPASPEPVQFPGCQKGRNISMEELLTINNLLERQKLMRKKFAKAAETVSLKTTATDSGTPSESKDHLPKREEAFITKLNTIIDDNICLLYTSDAADE